jgi:hypothetical protein
VLTLWIDSSLHWLLGGKQVETAPLAPGALPLAPFPREFFLPALFLVKSTFPFKIKDML